MTDTNGPPEREAGPDATNAWAGGDAVPGGYGAASPRIAKINQKPYAAPSSTGKKPQIMGWLDDFLDALGMTKDGLDKELESQEVLEARVELAQEVAEYWRSVSPIGDPETDPHAAEYRDSIEVEVDGNDVKVVARDDKAHLMEFGSVHNPEFAPRAKTWAHFSKQAERSAVALELNIKALLDESSARGAVRDAERFFEKKAADLKVDAKLNEIAARTAVGDAKEFSLGRQRSSRWRPNSIA